MTVPVRLHPDDIRRVVETLTPNLRGSEVEQKLRRRLASRAPRVCRA